MHLAFSRTGQSIALSTSLVTPPASINMIYNYSGLLRLKWSNCGTTRYCSEGCRMKIRADSGFACNRYPRRFIIRTHSGFTQTQDPRIFRIHAGGFCTTAEGKSVRGCHQKQIPWFGFRGWSVCLRELSYWCCLTGAHTWRSVRREPRRRQREGH